MIGAESLKGAEGLNAESFLVLLVVVAVVAAVVRFVRLPYTVALVLTGLALAFLPGMPRFSLTPSVILTVFLPVLLFYGAYNLNMAELRASLTSVTILAVPGVVATAGIVGLALHVATGLPWGDALLFGTIVAATDPVAVLAIFGDLGAPRGLSAIVTGESLFNDGTALVFFSTMLGVVTAHTFDVGGTVEHFAISIAGSLALGIAIGIVGSTVLHRIDDALLETTLTLIIAYGGYLLADHLGISGPLETVAAGLVLGVRGLDVMSPTTRLQAGATWEFLDFLANSLLFLLMGLALRPIGEATSQALGTGVVRPLLVAILAVIVARLALVAGVQVIVTRLGRPIPRGWPLVIMWAGLRGAVSLAAALSLPASLPYRDLLLILTFGVVLFTLLAQGLSISWLLNRLDIVSDEASRYDIEMALGRLRALEAAMHEVEAMRRSDAVDDHLAQRLLEGYAERRRALRAELDSVYHSDAVREREEEYQTLRHLLRVQHDAARAALARGQISHAVFRDLAAEIDREMGSLEVSRREP